MRWIISLILLLQSVFAEDIIVRTQLISDQVWVGQRMQLQIDVLGKDGWAQIADLSEVEVPGSYVRPSGNSRVRLNEIIAGASYTGQRYELSIYPQRAGEQVLPPIELKVRIQTWGAQNSTQEVTAQTEPIVFTTQLPKGGRSDLPLIASPKLTATQQWEPDQNEFTVGDALKRTITLHAADLPAMVLPPLEDAPVEGLSSYNASPRLSEDESTATRTESLTYVFKQDAKPTLPGYTFQWWNPTTETLEVIQLEGRSLQITGGASTDSAAVTTDSSWFKAFVVALTLIGISIVLLVIKQRTKTTTNRPLSEAALFKQLSAALRNDSPAQAIQPLLTWLDQIGLPPSQFFDNHADANTATTAHQLLSDPHQISDLSSFAKGLCQARKQYHNFTQTNLSKADALLPPLNH